MNISAIYELYKQFPEISTDSRQIKTDSLFFALKGSNFNGNEFAEQALENGARYCILDEKPAMIDERFILVENVLETLQELARHHRKQLNIPVLAITGSNGKTTTKELTAAVLAQKFRVFATHGNLNNHIGVPLSLLAIPLNCEIAIIEMGANHVGEIAFLCELAQPTHGLITNIGKAHLEGFGGFEGVKQAKGELYAYLSNHDGQVFAQSDDAVLREMLESATARTVFYGTHENDLRPLITGQLANDNSCLSLQWRQENQHSWQNINTQLVGNYNLDNVLAAISVGVHFHVSPELINQGISTYSPRNQRSQQIETDKKNIVVCDYYNANASSMEAAISHFRSQKAVTDKVLILGDMFELGDASDEEHLAVIQLAIASGAQRIIFVGKAFYLHKDKFDLKKDVSMEFYPTTLRAHDGLVIIPLTNAYILVKGSRGMALENLLPLL